MLSANKFLGILGTIVMIIVLCFCAGLDCGECGEGETACGDTCCGVGQKCEGDICVAAFSCGQETCTGPAECCGQGSDSVCKVEGKVCCNQADANGKVTNLQCDSKSQCCVSSCCSGGELGAATCTNPSTGTCGSCNDNFDCGEGRRCCGRSTDNPWQNACYDPDTDNCCTNPTDIIKTCPNGEKCCGDRCCSESEYCATVTVNPPGITGVCLPLECTDTDASACVSQFGSTGACCDGQCYDSSKNSCCGTTICSEDQECCGSGEEATCIDYAEECCDYTGDYEGMQCGLKGQCCKDKCCAEGQTCTDPTTGTCGTCSQTSDCGEGRRCCSSFIGSSCYDPNVDTCCFGLINPGILTCPLGRDCCGSICCPEGQTCYSPEYGICDVRCTDDAECQEGRGIAGACCGGTCYNDGYESCCIGTNGAIDICWDIMDEECCVKAGSINDGKCYFPDENPTFCT